MLALATKQRIHYLFLIIINNRNLYHKIFIQYILSKYLIKSTVFLLIDQNWTFAWYTLGLAMKLTRISQAVILQENILDCLKLYCQ